MFIPKGVTGMLSSKVDYLDMNSWLELCKYDGLFSTVDMFILCPFRNMKSRIGHSLPECVLYFPF